MNYVIFLIAIPILFFMYCYGVSKHILIKSLFLAGVRAVVVPFLEGVLLMKYTHILFDLDGTLFDFDKAEETAFLNTCRHFHIPDTKDNFLLYHKINAEQWKQYELGLQTQERLAVRRYQLLLDALHTSGDAVTINRYYKKELSVQNPMLPNALAVCYQLSRFLKLYLITNGTPETQWGRLEHSPITPYFTEIFISGEIGWQKPQKEFFDYVFSKINAEKEQLLVVGDSLSSDIKGGQNAGLDTCWICKKGEMLPDNAAIPTYIIHNLNELMPILLPAAPDNSIRFLA